MVYIRILAHATLLDTTIPSDITTGVKGGLYITLFSSTRAMLLKRAKIGSANIRSHT